MLFLLMTPLHIGIRQTSQDNLFDSFVGFRLFSRLGENVGKSNAVQCGKERASLHRTKFFLSKSQFSLTCDYERNHDKYQKLRNINTLALQYKALFSWSGLVISATCTQHMCSEVGTLRRLKKCIVLSVLCRSSRRILAESDPWLSLDHGICMCHLEWWPNNKADIDKAAELILPESRRKSTSIANKARSITLHWCYSFKSECVYRHKTYKACYQTHHHSQVINFAKVLPSTKEGSTQVVFFFFQSHHSLDWPASQFTFYKRSSKSLASLSWENTWKLNSLDIQRNNTPFILSLSFSFCLLNRQERRDR